MYTATLGMSVFRVLMLHFYILFIADVTLLFWMPSTPQCAALRCTAFNSAQF